MKRFLLPGLVVLFACLAATTGRPAAGENAVAGTDTGYTTVDSILRNWFARSAVDDRKPVTKTFWFWTDVRDLDSAVNEHSLLRRSDARSLPEQLYRRHLADKKWDRHPLAKLLRGSEFNRIQEAWSSYWPMLGENYEYDPHRDQLVKVVLQDSALIVVFHPDRKKNSWEVFDVNGNSISLPEAMRSSSRIAGVYFSSEKTIELNMYPCNFNTKRDKPVHVSKVSGYRSFILCNEAMIRSWHHAVPGMQDQLNNELPYLLLLDAWFAADPAHTLQPGKKGEHVKLAWKSASGLTPAQLCMKAFRYPMAADTGFTRPVIDEVRRRWPLQRNAIERYPSKGVR